MKTAIWWVRRDLRLSDNQALAEALHQAEVVLPVFILDDRLLASPYVGQARLAFLFAGLRELDARLRSRGSALILRQGDPLTVLSSLREETGAEAIFAEADFSPFDRRRDAQVVRRTAPAACGWPDCAFPRGTAESRRQALHRFYTFQPPMAQPALPQQPTGRP